MTLLSDILPFPSWNNQLHSDFLTIAGPCSVESEEQVLQTARKIRELTDVQVFRAGVWKPRTRPDSFEGVGEKAFPWLKKVKQKYGFLIACEVATSQHVEKGLANGIDIFWIGARTTPNPFAVNEIAEAFRGVDVPVMVKNPVNPDFGLWLGAIERLYKLGIHKLAAVHRGFFPFEQTKLRNIPKWEMAIELKSECPDIPLIADPSHMAGNIKYVENLAQKALDLNYNGLMIETHINPLVAKSDAKQQLTPEQLHKLLTNLIFKQSKVSRDNKNSIIENYRDQIDSIDYQMLELLAQRMEVVRKIGVYKKEHKITIFQLRRWIEILQTRGDFAKKTNLSPDFVKQVMRLIHKESIRQQTDNG